MNLKISKKLIISTLLILDFLISINFFYVYQVPWPIYIKIIIFVIASIVMGFDRAFCAPKRLKQYVGIFWLVVLIETVYSTFKYQQKITDVLKISLSFVILLGAFVYFSYFKYYDNIQRYLNKLVIIVVIMQGLLLVQAMLFNSGITSVQFLKVLFSSEATNEFGAAHIRNGMLRCGQFHKYVYLIYFYSLWSIIEKKTRRKKHIFCVILTFINEFYVGQTRGSFIILFVATVLVVLFALWQYRHEVLVTVIICISMSALIGTNLIEYLYTQFILQEVDTVSIRTYALEYFLGLLKKDPVFGIGMIYPVQGSRIDLWHILYGPDLWHKFVYSDIGILGAIVQYGFFSVFTFLKLFWDMIYATYKCLVCKTMYFFVFGFTLYCLGTCVTLLITINELPLVLGVYAFFLNNITVKNYD